MKKVIFLLVLIVSSVFGGSATASKLIPELNYHAVANSKNGCSFPNIKDPEPQIYNYLSPCYINDRLSNPPAPRTYSTSSCTISHSYINKRVSNNSYGDCVYDADRQETYNATWQCIPPSGGCPSGQVLNEQTCQCECAPPPTGYTHILHTLNTPELCTLVNASMALDDGDTFFLSNVIWDSCRNQCLGALQECPCNTAIKNGACVDITPPEGSCPTNAQFSNIWALCVGDGCKYPSGCTKQYLSDSGFICYTTDAGCCLGDSGNGGGTSDSNSTNPDSNTTDPSDPGDSGEDGEEDGGETGGGDSNTSTPAPGDSNTSTPAPGDSNTSTPAPGDSNTSTPYEEYEESDADKEGKGKIGDVLDEAVDTADKIKRDYERLMSVVINGVAPVYISSGSAPQFCAIVFGKQICINLCDSFGYFYTIFYYIFLILLTVMALRIYYTAFKMR